jgi:hypothetical protein
VAQRFVLDPLAAQVQLPCGQVHDMERVHHLLGFADLL